MTWRTQGGIGQKLGTVGTILSNPNHRVADLRERRAIWAAKYGMQYTGGNHPFVHHFICCNSGWMPHRKCGNIERSRTG